MKAAPRQRDRAESTARIIAAAISLFARRGYENTSLEEVALAAGFTKGAVYYYFRSKETLLVRVLHDIEARSIDQPIAAVRAAGGTPAQRLQAFIKLRLRWAEANADDLAVLMYLCLASAGDAARAGEQTQQFYDKLTDFLEKTIDEGKALGEFSTEQSARDIANYMIAVNDGNMLVWFRKGRQPEVGRNLARATLRMFEHALQRTVLPSPAPSAADSLRT